MNPLWARTCDVLRARVGERNFAAWIAPLRPVPAGDALTLDAPDGVTRDRVARHFLTVIEAALAEAAGRRVAVRLGLVPSAHPLPIPDQTPNPEHTFARFVLGESNARAAAAARGAAAGGPTVLSLHGPPGVGKTHLLHAVFHALADAGSRPACVPAARLVAALASARAEVGGGGFWAELFPLSALLVDDLHSVKALEETQERLAQGLVDWIDGGRTLVVTSDRPPADLPTLASGLRDRLGGGDVAGIGPPDPALRTAILHEKARWLGIRLDPEVAKSLARELGGDVRRLEGVLTRLVARARLSGRTIDEALADELLPVLGRGRPGTLTVARIVAATAAAFRTSPRGLRGRDRRQNLVVPRQVAMYLARELLRRPFAALAPEFGRDHTTLRHAWRATADRRAADPALDAAVAGLVRRLRREEEGR